MKKYQRILLALDLHPDNDKTTEKRALDIRHDTGAQLFLVHAVEHISSYGAAFAYPVLSDLETHLLQEATSQLEQKARELDVNDSDHFIEVGSVKPVIIDVALKIDADMIIVGSHTRHGYHLLFNNTADSLLHDSPCDVLAVKLDH